MNNDQQFRFYSLGGRYNIYNKGLCIENITEEDNGEYFCNGMVDVDGRWDSRKILVEVYGKYCYKQNMS